MRLIIYCLAFVLPALDPFPVLAGDGQAPDFLLSWGGPGSAPGEFDQPTDIALGPIGNVFVVAGGNSRIQKFTRDGTFILQWGQPGRGEGEFDQVSDIAVDPLGNVYVSERNLTSYHRVQKFDGIGTPLASWPIRATGLAVDSQGRIYAVDGYEPALTVRPRRRRGPPGDLPDLSSSQGGGGAGGMGDMDF